MRVSVGPGPKKALKPTKVKLKWNIGTKSQSGIHNPLFTSYRSECLQVP